MSDNVLDIRPTTMRLDWLVVVNGVLLAWLLMVGGVHAAGLIADARAAISTPLELDYGEGIVWQQAALMLGPRAYAVLNGLPLIVFHYPPLFHLVARAAQALLPDSLTDLLAAGRLVSSVSTFVLVPLVAWLALLATPVAARRQLIVVAAIIACSLVLTAMAPVRMWGVLMRVDMLGLAFGFAGLVAGALAQGRFWGTLAALLLCLAAVFTKQTMMSFGIAVALLSVVRRPRPAVLAVLGAGTIGLACVIALQVVTGGGFLHNIVNANVNRFSVPGAVRLLTGQRINLLVFATMLAAAGWLLVGLGRTVPVGPTATAVWRLPVWLNRADVVTWRRALVVVHLVLSCLVLVTLFKVGGSVNYMLELCGAGCVALGVALAALLSGEGRQWGAALLLIPLIVGVALQPSRVWVDETAEALLLPDAALVQRIRASPRPVASENMVLLMRAGRGVVYEPAIATELAYTGQWDEAPLVAMLRGGGFAFMLTKDGGSEPTDRRTNAVNAAVQEAFPRIRQLRHELWLREPKEGKP